MGKEKINVIKTYEQNAEDELQDNSNSVRRLEARIEDILIDTRTTDQRQASKVCEMIDEDLQELIRREILRSRNIAGEEIQALIGQDASRELQKEEENVSSRRTKINIDESFEDIRTKINRILVEIGTSNAEEAIYEIKRTLDKGKDDIIDRYDEYTKDNQRKIDKSLEELQCETKSIMDELKGKVRPIEDSFHDYDGVDSKDDRENTFHTYTGNKEKSNPSELFY